MLYRAVVCCVLMVLGVGLEARAQSRRTAPPRASKAKTRQLAPAAPVGPLPLLPRFWQLADSAERADAAEVVNQYLRHFITYPVLALQAGVSGALYALLTVLPDGRVGGITISRRDLGAGAPPIKAVLALDAELQRVAWQLRFKPDLLRRDSTSIGAGSPAAAPDVIDITDQSESTEGDDSIDVTDDSAAARPPADTVTVVYRFGPPEEGKE